MRRRTQRLLACGALLPALLGLAGCPDPVPYQGTAASSSGSSSGSGSGGGAPGAPVVKGAFVGAAVKPASGAAQVRGQLVWHARVTEGKGDVRVNGWLR